MGKRSHKAKRTPPPSASDDLSGGASGHARPTGKTKRRTRPRRRRPVLRFVLTFVILMGAFELASATSFVRNTVFPAYLTFNAEVSAAILSLVEDSVSVHGNSIHGRYPLTIERGCDAIEPSALFLSGVLAFPATFWVKLPGMLLGTLCLMVINLVRIITLFYVGVYYPKYFHVAHVDVWQSLFVFLAILFWILWALWATREKTVTAHASPQAR